MQLRLVFNCNSRNAFRVLEEEFYSLSLYRVIFFFIIVFASSTMTMLAVIKIIIGKC